MPGKRARADAIEPGQVKEDLRRHIGDASRRLSDAGAISDEQIHSARKDLKRARASLRLLRGIVGAKVYARENAALRDAARPLSGVRDAKVVMDTVEALLESPVTPAQRTLLQGLHTGLEKARHDARASVHGGGTLGASAKALELAWKRVDGWRVARNRAADVHEGLERVYRAGRKALARVEADASAGNLHEWRKQVKYLGNAMEILSAPGARAFGKHRKHADSVAQALGDDHDLVVLSELIRGARTGSSRAHRSLASRIAARREALQSKALKTGRRLYKLKPGAFIRNVKRASRRPPPNKAAPA